MALISLISILELDQSLFHLFNAEWTNAMFDAILIAGLALIPISLLSFGVAMRNHTDFDAVYAWLGIVLGILGLGAISFSMIDPDSLSAAIVVFGMIIFHFSLGWKLYKLSR